MCAFNLGKDYQKNGKSNLCVRSFLTEHAGIPGLCTVDLSKTCLISTFQDYLMGALSPVRLASLHSLNLSNCNLYLSKYLKHIHEVGNTWSNIS